MTLDDAIELALAAGLTVLPFGEHSPGPLPLTGTPDLAGLTAREVEVPRLLAQELTYAQIAEQQFISRRTVNGHATSIYGKLGVTSRAAATRFAPDHHLV